MMSWFRILLLAIAVWLGGCAKKAPVDDDSAVALEACKVYIRAFRAAQSSQDLKPYLSDHLWNKIAVEEGRNSTYDAVSPNRARFRYVLEDQGKGIAGGPDNVVFRFPVKEPKRAYDVDIVMIRESSGWKVAKDFSTFN